MHKVYFHILVGELEGICHFFTVSKYKTIAFTGFLLIIYWKAENTVKAVVTFCMCYSNNQLKYRLK